MINIEYVESSEEFGEMIDIEFDKFAAKADVICNYTPFTFVAKENNEIIGIITGHSYYKEVYVSDIIIFEQYRNKHIGSKLIETVENHYKDKGFENINLTTYHFQAPEFYKKMRIST